MTDENIDFNEDSLTKSTQSKTKYFESATNKYKNTIDSAVSLLIVGVGGLIILLLIYFDIIHFNINPTTRTMMLLVMGAVFLVFIISGFISLKSSKKYKTMIVAESSKSDEIVAFIKNNISKDEIDTMCKFSNTDTDEEKCFARIEIISSILASHFSDFNETMISDIIDNEYDNIFN